MGLRESLSGRLRPALFLGRNPLTLLGAALTTASAITLLVFWVHELLRGGDLHAYIGILLFLVLPGLFVLGLLLMPLGIWWRRRALRRRGTLPTSYPQVDLADPLLRRAALGVAGLTVVNVALVGTASYRAVEYMDSVTFCGTACHSVMAPEHTAYLNSAHSRVACTQCHIGPGAGWFVRSKLSGARQLLAVNLGTYSRPIPTPVRHLRPARETCEQCHWPQKFHGDKFLVRRKYADDEHNTETVSVLVLKVGGRDGRGHAGIHGRHLDEASRITYLTTDERRQVIPLVTYVDDAGRAVDFVSTETPPTAEQRAQGQRRSMDCLDCHNRPSHTFELPERALDRALAEGGVSRELPWVKKQGVALLRASYPDRETAFRRIVDGLVSFYREQHPQVYQSHRAQIEAAAQRLVDIYRANVFPNMNVQWGTYPNNIGHEDFLGCFRCHDDNHKSADGRTISQDCSACHTVLAMDESDPKILSDLGLK